MWQREQKKVKTSDSGGIASGRCVIMSPVVAGGTRNGRSVGKSSTKTVGQREESTKGGKACGRGSVLSANNVNHTGENSLSPGTQ